MFQIKSVMDIKPAIEKFLSAHLTQPDIKILISDPWYPFPNYESEKDSIYLLGGKTGIYIFSKPNTMWSVRLEENSSNIWYIGKSVNNTIRGRVWKHLGPISGAKRTISCNGKSTKGLFIAKKWESRSNVPQHIKDDIVLGNL